MTATPLANKLRAKRRHRAYRRGGLVALVAAPLLLLGLAAYSPVLDVDTVRVTGNDRLSYGGIVRTARVARGTPLVSLDVGAVRRRVAALPGVKSATVTRSWPSAVTIHVVERIPVVAVPRDQHLDLYDVEAVRVAVARTAPPSLPRLAVGTGTPTPAVIDAAVALLRALPESLRDDVRGLRADGPASLSFSLADGAVVEWGSADRTADKVRALLLLVGQHAQRYDVTVPDHPAVVPRSP